VVIPPNSTTHGKQTAIYNAVNTTIKQKWRNFFKTCGFVWVIIKADLVVLFERKKTSARTIISGRLQCGWGPGRQGHGAPPARLSRDRAIHTYRFVARNRGRAAGKMPPPLPPRRQLSRYTTIYDIATIPAPKIWSAGDYRELVHTAKPLQCATDIPILSIMDTRRCSNSLSLTIVIPLHLSRISLLYSFEFFVDFICSVFPFNLYINSILS